MVAASWTRTAAKTMECGARASLMRLVILRRSALAARRAAAGASQGQRPTLTPGQRRRMRRRLDLIRLNSAAAMDALLSSVG